MMLEAALEYAARRWPVFPIYEPRGGEVPCSCGDRACTRVGKHPRTFNGFKDATTDEATIRAWWEVWPGANLGIATGERSGVDVLDVDPRHGGDETLAQLIREHGELPETVEVATGGGGLHLFFRASGLRSRGNAAPGLDVRGEGGYVVAPPSLHESGERYSWRVHPDEVELAEPPAWLRAELERAPAVPSAAERTGGGIVGEGARNELLTSLAGTMRRRGMSSDAIRAALEAENRTRCVPPLPAAEVRKVAASVSRYAPAEENEPAPTWSPFPVDALPARLREFALEGAEAIRCDASFLALPALVVCAGATARSRAVRIKPGWTEPSVLWGCTVGRSGLAKSPALEHAAAPLRELDAAAHREFKRAHREYREDVERYKLRLKRWKEKGEGSPPLPPDEPRCARAVVSDTTIEALARVLDDRGAVTVIRDELAAWLRSWDEYKAAGASSAGAKWLELHRAGALTVDRVGLGRQPIQVARAAVSIVGGTQPAILARLLTPEHLEAGCAARLLFAWPPARPREWSDAGLSERTRERYADVVHRLHALTPVEERFEDGETAPRPRELPLSREARELFAQYVDELGVEAHEAAADEAASASKLEGGAARLALVLELAGAEEPGRVAVVGEDAMRRGIVLARWLFAEARRVLALVRAEGGTDRAEGRPGRLLAWIRSRGEVSERDMARGPREFRGEERRREALEVLVARGALERIPGPRGPRFRAPAAGDVGDDLTPGDTGDGDTCALLGSPGGVLSPSPLSPGVECRHAGDPEREAIQAVEAEEEARWRANGGAS